MSQGTRCRLCWLGCDDFVSLYDENGHRNSDLYETSVKFFDPKFLTIDQESQLTAMCLGCWRHISEFNTFQKTIISTQLQLLNNATAAVKPSENALNVAFAITIPDEATSFKQETPSETKPLSFTISNVANVQTLEIVNCKQEQESITPPQETTLLEPLSFSVASSSNNFEALQTEICKQQQSMPPKEEALLEPLSFSVTTMTNDFQPLQTETLTILGQSNETPIVVNEAATDEFSILEQTNDTPLVINEAATDVVSIDDSSNESCAITCNSSASGDYDEPVGVFTGGEFSNAADDDDVSQSLMMDSNYIELSSDESNSVTYMDDNLTVMSNDKDENNECSNESSSYYDTVNRRMKNKYRKFDQIIAKWKNPLNCRICNEAFSSWTLLADHFKTAHPSEKCSIKCCNRNFELRFMLVEHAQYHLNPDKYKCLICGGRYVNTHALRCHLYRKHPWSKPSIAFKKQKHSTAKELDIIIAKWNQYLECGICNELHKDFTLLRTHFNLKHATETCHVLCCNINLKSRREIADHALYHMDPNAFKCQYCDKTYMSSLRLYTHAYNRHPKESITRRKPTTDDINETNQSNCNQMESVVNRSRTRVEDASGEAVHKCGICDKTFISKQYMREHMRTGHTNEDIYKCISCPQTFRHRFELYRHLMTTHPLKWSEGKHIPNFIETMIIAKTH